MSIVSDEQLVKTAREGDKAAFKELVKRLEPRVAATVYGMLGRCPEAEDVGQEVFIRFYKALNTFRGESSVASYITRIAINLSLNELKRRKRGYAFFSRDDDENTLDIPDPKGSGLPFEDKEIINWALQKLRPEYRSVIVLRLIEGYSTEETANILKVPVGTVTSRLARSQMKLKEILTPYFEDEI